VTARLRAFAGSPAGRALGAIAGLVLIALLLLRLRDLWAAHPIPLSDTDIPMLVAALAASFAAMLAYALVWGPALRAAGGEPPDRMLAPFFAGQLGKYLPGGAWQWVGRAALIMRQGVPAGPAAASLGLEAIASALAAAFVAPLAAGRDGLAAAVAAAALVAIAARLGAVQRLARRIPGLGAVDLRLLPGLVARYTAVWFVFGLAFWLTARALYGVPVSDYPRYTGVFAAAWVVGFVIVFAPGGLGAREAVIYALLRGHLGEGEAIVLATASRICFTIVDLAAGIPALVAIRRQAPAPREASG
jgi:glycosyltransferase 2 family protein